MAIKYEIEYNDVVNVLHRFELYDDNYTGDPIPVNGKVVLDYGEVDENLEAIRGQGLRVDLEANQSLTFEELFEENEKTFKCIYYRSGVILFQGWLNPEGFFEDYVNDKWVVSFDCIDGLGYLKDLAFVNDNGTNITGVKTQLEILSLALRRTGILVDINVDIDVFYTGLADTNSILENVKANTKRYIKDDESTVMDCEEVIRDVLEPYGAVLTSYNGQWAIYKPNQLVSNQTATFFRYDYLGVALSPATVTFDFDFTIGSHLDGFDPHYVNGNQSFTNKPSIGAYRISYKYGLFKDLIQNTYLETLDGSTVSEFDILNPSNVYIGSPNSFGIIVRGVTTGVSVPEFQNTPKTIPIDTATTITLKETFTAVFSPSSFVDFYYNVKLTNGGTTYYLNNSSQWVLSTVYNLTEKLLLDIETTITIDTPPAPIAGDISLVIKTPLYVFSGVLQRHEVNTSYFSIKNTTGESDLEGETFTFEREDKPSSRIEKTKQVLTGDSNLDIYQGTLYKADGTTPTETWYRKGVTETEPILSIMGAETMRMNQNTMRIFSGDVFGYFNYLSVITIDGRAGKFGVTKYSYDTYNNVISMTIKQMFSAELTDLSVTPTLDYGNVVEPTIRG